MLLRIHSLLDSFFRILRKNLKCNLASLSTSDFDFGAFTFSYVSSNSLQTCLCPEAVISGHKKMHV